jgi:lipopolysaccharide transport system permease protein
VLILLVWRNVRVRYRHALLGVTWAVLQPAAMMVIFSVVIRSRVADATTDVPYTVFVYAGLLPWTFFSTAVTTSATSFLSSRALIGKVYFPRLYVPAATVLTALVDLAAGYSLLVILMLVYGVWPSRTILLLPVALLLLLCMALAVGTVLSVLVVRIRDVRYIVTFMMQVWLLATPTIYLADGSGMAAEQQPAAETQTDDGQQVTAQAQSRLRWLRTLNPMCPLISFVRQATLGGPLDWLGLCQVAVIALVLVPLSVLLFRSQEPHLADLL